MSETGPYKREGETVEVTGGHQSRGDQLDFLPTGDHDKNHRDPNWLYYQYHVPPRKNMPEMAESEGVNVSTIERWFKKHQIPTRTPRESKILQHYGSLDPPWGSADKLRELYNGGLSIGEIAEKYDLDYATIWQAFERNGIPTRRQGKKSWRVRFPQLTDKDWLREQYIDLERSQKEIANGVGSSEATVHRALKEAGIRRRTSKETQLKRYQESNSVPKSRVPPPGEHGKERRETTSDEDKVNLGRGKKKYSGPSRGLDLSWADSSKKDFGFWVPYRDKEWLDWQLNRLEKSKKEVADLCGVTGPTIRHWIDELGINDN